MATSSGAEIPRNLEFLFSRNRLNVAISRAQCLAVLVASPELLHIRCRNVDQLRMVNALCRLVEVAQEQGERRHHWTIQAPKIRVVNQEGLWRVPVRGHLPDDVLGKLSDAGISRKGGSTYSSGGGGAQESHGLYVHAESADAAAQKVSAALEGVPVYVAADETQRIERSG